MQPLGEMALTEDAAKGGRTSKAQGFGRAQQLDAGEWLAGRGQTVAEKPGGKPRSLKPAFQNFHCSQPRAKSSFPIGGRALMVGWTWWWSLAGGEEAKRGQPHWA